MFKRAAKRISAAIDAASHGQAALAQANHQYGEGEGFASKCYALRLWTVDFISALLGRR
ncbi:hypothetical protein [Achromobacter xylosoxidans]|uniref:hypothetical protein n=1 Tax=Alcaligenes xylosoxydans xylosoxydans TaxID=85698 RepID=UPI0015C633AD|nr:hypothetical protein [Achromobacter xylosoxidans]